MRDRLAFLAPPLLVPFVILLAAGCGSDATPEPTFDCNPACGPGFHCTAQGCMADSVGEPRDLAASGDLAMACSSMCAAPTPYCNANGSCVPCVEDSHCPPGNYCHVLGNTSVCLPGCSDDARCGAGPGMKCCGNSCADTATDPHHCGDCATQCAPPHAAGACAGGKCAVGACDPSWDDCNHEVGDGCEVNLRVDANHCGACGAACALANATSACGRDGCYIANCDFGWEDCDASAMSGCETTVASDAKNCGSCGRACAGVPRAQVACAVGACVVQSCSMGFGDCNGVYNDGCEINMLTDRFNCGKCGMVCGQGQVCVNGLCDCPVCSFPNAKAICVAKVCTIDSCLPGFANCDGSSQNGCETPTGANNKNCGGCGVVCPQNLVCANGGCTCPQCNIPNAKSACINNVCTFDSCLPGFANCDNNTMNGCEVATDADAKNCGGCGIACGGQTPFCLGGVCSAGGLNCADILKAIPNAKSGVWTIDPDGNGGAAPFLAYCDMSTAAGGWTMVLNLDTSDGHVMWWAEPLWENNAAYGDVQTPFDGDHKSPAWTSLSATTEILLVVHEQGAYRGWKEFRKVDGRTLFQYFGDNKDNTLITNGAVASDTANIAFAKERLVRNSTQLYANHCILNGASCTSGAVDASPDGDRIGSNEATPANNDGGGLGNWHDMNLCCMQWGMPATSGKTCVGNAGFKSFRTASEAQAGWGPCWNGQAGMFGSDSVLPPSNTCHDSCDNANWAGSSGVDYDYALFVR